MTTADEFRSLSLGEMRKNLLDLAERRFERTSGENADLKRTMFEAAKQARIGRLFVVENLSPDLAAARSSDTLAAIESGALRPPFPTTFILMAPRDDPFAYLLGVSDFLDASPYDHDVRIFSALAFKYADGTILWHNVASITGSQAEQITEWLHNWGLVIVGLIADSRSSATRIEAPDKLNRARQTRQAADPAVLEDRAAEADRASSERRARGYAAVNAKRNARFAAPARSARAPAPFEGRPHGVGEGEQGQRAGVAPDSRPVVLRNAAAMTARSAAERARLLDAIARLWPALSQAEIARRLGVEAGVVSGLVMRARRSGDRRFPFRPRPESNPKAKPKRRVVKPAVVVRPPPAPPTPRLLVHLGPKDCRFAVNSPAKGEAFWFCGAASAAGSAYCERHKAAIASASAAK